MDRRQFLATGATVAATVAGGCVGCATVPTLSLSMEETADEVVADRLTTSLESDTDAHRIALEAAEAGANETATGTGIDEPFPTDQPYVHDGSVYVAAATVTDETPGRSFQYTINPVDEGESVDPEDEIRSTELPEVDREAFADRGWDDDDPVLGYSTSVHYLEADVDDSVLVPEPEYEVIAWPETRGRFEVDGSVEAPLRTYEYTAKAVADSVAAYGREVRDLVAFDLGPLEEDAAAVVDEAIADPPYVVPTGEELSEPEHRVVEQFEGEERIRRPGDPSRGGSGVGGEYLLEYEDALYWTEIYGSRD
ncbi:twin-arginine translocation signal domain-containing protein [Natrarchaeobaculum sulfurireducens]|uniref:Uncharacterized protein n=1 Tax=Natrarchaeobaculum sulfurireducens TaxID=2044521 RepID=A0A346PM11_9EURY|nr:twin-arginine translocation signal domain-containing protein [Natrarchaeobaculum sulfurireducens]AXR76890.1 hypothetical protein AArc1_0546 [Natrarchaeobaculum sulfurireducens]AXR80556.1 hypothetical protein AArcMg_0533 [Natrarchaeobaculum sulfurireducens]